MISSSQANVFAKNTPRSASTGIEIYDQKSIRSVKVSRILPQRAHGHLSSFLRSTPLFFLFS